MARVLHNDIWYDELGPGSLYEAEFERIVIQYLDNICPGFVPVPFKITVTAAHGAARADLALVQSNYLAWWVVEVELTSHSLKGHVLPQVETLADAAYGRREADYLASKSERLDRVKLRDMVLGEQPRVLVIANSRKEGWEEPLRRLGARLAFFQLFRSDRGRQLALTNGYWPTAGRETRSRCYVHPVMRKLLVVRSPAILPAATRKEIDIYYGGQLTTWRRVDTSNEVRLMPLVNVTLDTREHFELVATPTSLRLEHT